MGRRRQCPVCFRVSTWNGTSCSICESISTSKTPNRHLLFRSSDGPSEDWRNPNRSRWSRFLNWISR